MGCGCWMTTDEECHGEDSREMPNVKTTVSPLAAPMKGK